MRRGLWEVYARLQSVHAYGDKVQTGHYGDIGPLSFPAPVDLNKVVTVLQIGPGGASEVVAVRKALGETPRLTVATLFDLEAIIIERDPNVGRNTSPIVGDMHDLPLNTGAFDLILASQVLEHAFAPYIALMECRRLLREGGWAWFILPSFDMEEGGRGPYHLHCLTEEVWRELLRKVGLPAVNVTKEPGATGGVYTSYVCQAVAPPAPHNRVLAEVSLFKSENPHGF